MLKSIGYQFLKDPQQMIKILLANDVDILIDVRSKPYGRKREFNREQLRRSIRSAGIRYYWKGDRLGGFDPITQEAIDNLAEWQVDQNACLMCMEGDPNRCHRKMEISRRLEAKGVEVEHILTDAKTLKAASADQTAPPLFDL